MRVRNFIEKYFVGVKEHNFRFGKGEFYARKQLARSNVLKICKRRDEILIPYYQSSFATPTKLRWFLSGIPTSKSMMHPVGSLPSLDRS